MDKQRLLEGFILITAHLKSSCRHFSSFSMCDFNSKIPVTSSIKAFIDGTVFLLVVSSVLLSNFSITKTKIIGEITHPIIIPMFNFCQFVEYLALENLIYVYMSWYKLSNVFWDPKEIHYFLDKWVPYWAICIIYIYIYIYIYTHTHTLPQAEVCLALWLPLWKMVLLTRVKILNEAEVFPFLLMPLGKVWIHLFSPLLWENSWTNYVLYPWQPV